MKLHHRITRHLGRNREAVRCADGRWRIFELRPVDWDGEASRRWVCVHAEPEKGRWPKGYFDKATPNRGD